MLRTFFGVTLVLILSIRLGNAEYALPAGRGISWNPAGLDVIGGIPTSHAHTTAVTGLVEGGTTGGLNNLQKINAAIAAASGDTLLTIPAGVYLIQSGTGDDVDIKMKSNVVLRGAKASGPPYLPTADPTATTLILDGCRIFFRGGDKASNWTPGPQDGYDITAGYTQGSTALTLASGAVANLAVNDYVSVYQNKDTAAIDDKNLTYLGEDSGSDSHVWAQYTKIASISGNVITIDPPLYQVTPFPSGQRVRKQSFGITNAGVENMRLDGNSGSYYRILHLQFCKFCWVKGVETYFVGANSSGSPHIWTQFSYGNEYRSNYHHKGAGYDSGACYGIEFYNWNSRHKIEDNIVRETRHSIIFEGGGSGCVILNNYIDDNGESVQGQPTVHDTNFLSEEASSNHGAHPYMNLWEGNWAPSWWGDYTQGSSSYVTAFRNSFSGKQTSYTLTNPFLWTVIEVETYNRYYNIIGNIVGNATMTGGTVIDNNTAGPKPEMFRFGYDGAGGGYGDSQSYSTAILHGNYDFVSGSIHDWNGDHTLPTSLYYTSKPTFFGSLAWPPYDSTFPCSAAIARIPAGYRFQNGVDPVGVPTPTPCPPFSTPTATPITQITVVPTAITFTGIPGGAFPAPQSVQITPSNGGSWTSSDTSPWFDAAPTSGAGGTSTTLTPHTEGLAAGTYTQNITFSATGCPNKVVVVTLILTSATPTPTPTPTVTISGTVLYCSNPVPGPVPGVTLTLSGSASGTTVSDSAGNYTFSSLASGGTYTVTPTKAALPPASSGISGTDVIAMQRHILNIELLTGCRLAAADVNGDGNVTTIDSIAQQRFVLGMTTGIANTGKYQFTPASVTYTNLTSNQTGQNYNALVFGDVAPGYVHRDSGPSQAGAGDRTSARDVSSTVAAVMLPGVATDHSGTNFVAQVNTTVIDPKDKLVGFQGDFTFDERVVRFQDEPVQKAGITGGNWNVSGNVLPGRGPIRTLRISAYSNDFAPLSGKGTLFELRMTRVIKNPGASTQLVWAAPPNGFIFIDQNLQERVPLSALPGNVPIGAAQAKQARTSRP